MRRLAPLLLSGGFQARRRRRGWSSCPLPWIIHRVTLLWVTVGTASISIYAVDDSGNFLQST
jgi:hypothetical protein